MKKILGWIFIALCMAVIANATVIKDKMTYEGTVTFLGDFINTGTFTQTGAVGITGVLTQTGDVNVTGDLDVISGVLTSGTTTVEIAASGATVTLTAEYNHVNINMAALFNAGLGVKLPTATAALDGYEIGFKKLDSGTTAFHIVTPNTNDLIEETRGTLTGTDDDTMDAAGDYKAFRLDWRSGVSPVWLQTKANQA